MKPLIDNLGLKAIYGKTADPTSAGGVEIERGGGQPKYASLKIVRISA